MNLFRSGVGSGAFPAPHPIHAARENVLLAARGDGSRVAMGVTGAINYATDGRSGAVIDAQSVVTVALDAANRGGVVG